MTRRKAHLQTPHPPLELPLESSDHHKEDKDTAAQKNRIPDNEFPSFHRGVTRPEHRKGGHAARLTAACWVHVCALL